MFASKYFLIVAFITFLMLGATIFFQVQEFQEYNLLETLQERFFSGGSTAKAAVPVAAAPVKVDENAKTAKKTE